MKRCESQMEVFKRVDGVLVVVSTHNCSLDEGHLSRHKSGSFFPVLWERITADQLRLA